MLHAECSWIVSCDDGPVRGKDAVIKCRQLHKPISWCVCVCVEESVQQYGNSAEPEIFSFTWSVVVQTWWGEL